ncbi:MAG: molybdate-binding protein [Gracilibacter sp. BRH_c7a]|nr:MAG: molybdate-binding protein [Gracilibacter sp. BRH_c7a]
MLNNGKEGLSISAHLPLTPEEAAQILKISRYTLYELIKRGEIPARRIGRKIRIDYDMLQQYLQGNSMPNVQHSKVSELPPACPQFRFLGSHDPILELLREFLSHSSSPIILNTSFQGSMEGLISLYRRETELTGIHLWDEKSEDYNLPFIKYLLPCEPLTVINLVQRVQGFIVPTGNPFNLKSWSDITTKDIHFVNRQKGSGTRLRLDYFLQEHGISPSEIQGYEQEENTHSSVAMKIANDKANVGLGIQAAAYRMGLDFIPLFKERYDLVVLQENSNRPEWGKILSVLNSSAFHKAIEQQAGYDASLTGKIMLETK